MEQLSRYLPLILVALLLPRVLPPLLGLFAVMRLSLRPIQPEPQPRSAMPAHLRSLLDGLRADLEACGFSYAYSVRHPSHQVGEGVPDGWHDIYWNPAPATLASVHVSTAPQGSPYGVFMNSVSADGRLLLTLNRLIHVCPGFPADVQVSDAAADSVAGQWAHHLGRVAQHLPLLTERVEIMRRTRLLDEKIAAHWLASGMVQEDRENPGRLRFRPGPAWRFVRAMLKGGRQRLGAFRYAHPPAPQVLAGVEAEAAVRDLAVQRSGRLPRSWRWGLFGVSAGLAALAFGWWLGWEIVPGLLLALAIHEGGHYLAMRMLGYRNVNVFFVPFLGAATTGLKEDARPLQEVLTYLAGPAAGLLFGVLALALAAQVQDEALGDMLQSFAILSLILNYLNLLPVSPLDGGRVVEVALLARTPRLRVVFMLLGVLAMLGWGLFSGERTGLVLGVLVALSLPFQFRVATALRSLRGHLRASGATAMVPADTVRWTFQHLHERAAALPYNDRLAVARDVSTAMQRPLPTWGSTAAAFGLYGAVVLLPLVTVLLLWFSGLGGTGPRDAPASAADAQEALVERGPSAVQRATVAALHAMPPDAVRWETAMKLLARSDEEAEGFDPARSPLHYSQFDEVGKLALDSARQLPPSDPRRVRTVLDFLYYAEEEARVPLLQVQAEALRALPPADPEQRSQLAHTLERLAMQEGTTADTAIALLQEELELLAGSGETFAILSARSLLGRWLVAAGRGAEAEALLERNMADSAQGEGSFLAPRQRAEYAWYLIGQGRAGEAVALLNPPLAASAAGAADEDLAAQAMRQQTRVQLLTPLVWAHIARRDYAAAEAALEAQGEAVDGMSPFGDGLLGWVITKLVLRGEATVSSPMARDRLHLLILQGRSQEAEELLAQMREAGVGAAFDRGSEMPPPWEQPRVQAHLALSARLAAR